MVGTIIGKQPGNETDLESLTALTGNQETAKRQLKLPDEIFAIVPGGPNQPKNFPRKPSVVRINWEVCFKLKTDWGGRG